MTKDTDVGTQRERDRQTDRQTQRGRQTDRQTETGRDIDRDREIWFFNVQSTMTITLEREPS